MRQVKKNSEVDGLIVIQIQDSWTQKHGLVINSLLQYFPCMLHNQKWNIGWNVHYLTNMKSLQNRLKTESMSSLSSKLDMQQVFWTFQYQVRDKAWNDVNLGYSIPIQRIYNNSRRYLAGVYRIEQLYKGAQHPMYSSDFITIKSEPDLIASTNPDPVGPLRSEPFRSSTLFKVDWVS